MVVVVVVVEVIAVVVASKQSHTSVPSQCHREDLAPTNPSARDCTLQTRESHVTEATSPAPQTTGVGGNISQQDSAFKRALPAFALEHAVESTVYGPHWHADRIHH